MAQISINDKTEETELLKEYIIMEKERLDANKKTFQEDKDKYEKYKMDLQNKSSVTEDQVREANREIDQLLAEMHRLRKEESTLISSHSKTQEELNVCRTHKKFLDLLAIGAGQKKPWPQRKHQEEFLGPADGSDGGASPANMKARKAQNKKGDSTFMT